ncbi:antibiotic biosynthesis monooxygenase [Pigmentiphaga litoralis]|uniref:antibiotic biosynthesis monooxygenase n=1 Tax=Pigmentiphaga litoralis TaxID=516702 RepID=UPI003B4307D2
MTTTQTTSAAATTNDTTAAAAAAGTAGSIPSGMIAVWLHVAPEREEEFNAWYEREHIPQIVDLDGFVSGTRYFSDEAFPKFLALYETVDESVEASPGFQHVTTHPSPWSGRIWSFFGKDRIRLNLRQLALAPGGTRHADPAQHAGSSVVVRHTRRPLGLTLEQARQEAAATREMTGCRRYRVYQETHDDARYVEILEFTSVTPSNDEALAAWLSRPERQAMDAGVQDVQQNVYHAIGTPYVRTDR